MNKIIGFDLISIVASITLLTIGIIVSVFGYKNKNRKHKKKLLDELDIEKNQLDSYPIETELLKVEPLIKNAKLELKYNGWKERFQNIRENNLFKLNEYIIKLESLGNNSAEEFDKEYEYARFECYKAKYLLDILLKEIEDINFCEEKYRSIIIDLKSKYRELFSKYENNKNTYGELSKTLELQFENIEKRFQLFEEFMSQNDYDEVLHIIKSMDILLNNLQEAVEKSPKLILLSHKIIPIKINEITDIYEEMINENYNLTELEIPQNMEYALTQTNELIEKVKSLNFNNVEEEFNKIIEYLDYVFTTFDKEKISKGEYKNNKKIFEKQLLKSNKLMSSIFNQLGDIIKTYNLKDDDLLELREIKKQIFDINYRYKDILDNIDKNMYLQSNSNILELARELNKLDSNLDKVMKTLGNLYEDEKRAREQLSEIEKLLSETKEIITSYDFPTANSEYNIELQEANDSVYLVLKELGRKPIIINQLNLRVDNARDLALKVYYHTKTMRYNAEKAEQLMIFANRYRYHSDIVNERLNKATRAFYSGDYNKSVNIIRDTLETFVPEIKDFIQ